MFADAAVDDFYAMIRKKSASIMLRVRGSGNSILQMVAGRLDPGILARFIDLHVNRDRRGAGGALLVDRDFYAREVYGSQSHLYHYCFV
jgi:electron transfer flavoprotein alpha subunit